MKTSEQGMTEPCQVCSLQAARDKRMAALSRTLMPMQAPRIIGAVPAAAALLMCSWWQNWGSMWRQPGDDE